MLNFIKKQKFIILKHLGIIIKKLSKSNLSKINLIKLLRVSRLPIIKQMTAPKINLFQNLEYDQCQNQVIQWETKYKTYYQSIMCLQPVTLNKNTLTLTTAWRSIEDHVTNEIDELTIKDKSKLCVLPVGHSGKCSFNPHNKIFTHKRIKDKIQTSIYSTPGNDDYIFKNRHDRLFPICLPATFERMIRDKTKKKKCAIPLKDSSTPLMLATAYFDFLILTLYILGIESHIDLGSEYFKNYQEIIYKHKLYMKESHICKDKLFNKEGHTLCPITGQQVSPEDFAQVESNRDTRINPKGNDIQMGHGAARKDTEYTIRGLNITLMTRDGNRIQGDYNYDNSEWRQKIENIIAFHNFKV